MLLKNTGNVQEEPTGHILVTDMFGKGIATVNVNMPPRNILPDSSRLFTGTLGSSELGNKRLFGRYHAVLSLAYGSATAKTLTDSLYFWVIPFKLIAAIIILLVVGFFILRTLIRMYNRNIISRAQKVQGTKTKKKSR